MAIEMMARRGGGIGALVLSVLAGWAAGALAQPAGTVAPLATPTVRIADLARLEGLRPNQLVGLGLVVGLEGTGDSRGVSVQMVANMLRNFGLAVDPGQLRARNVAAVMVTALLPSLARPGDRVDVTVSSMGDARSLAGGVLLQTPLQGADGEVYAVAQGPLVVGGSTARTVTAQRVHPTVASIPRGAIVERAVPAAVAEEGMVRLVLYQPDFTTAARMVDAINQELGAPLAFTLDGAVVTVRLPREYQQDPALLVARLEQLSVTPSAPAKVVINERSGTVVLGHQVRIAPVAVAHAGIRVEVGTTAPDGLDTTLGALPGIGEPPAGHAALVQAGASVAELVDALNASGLSPRDVIAILEAIRAAGALYAELEVL
ncbi:flagellar basal body P-ring protein FlgI [Geochorda subterranea]|uniref:Flagellar P-ring protein n=1 Tax=Geochorda subterranea TaxID=3109564 RepID=A0ABZ1BQD3_9FIRM|nr:flagellar basal body P-ring protein FlgI [Limnochorda sp. LNt]WRP14843.1 flagellar basal body P-ring protein FlgI [Limnochorda sp. LNt]